MKTIPLSFSALLLAASVSVATATPHKDGGPTGRTSYTEEPAPPASDAMSDEARATGGWVELANPTPCAHGRTYVTLDESTAPMARLRIDAHKGRAVIKGVKVTFKDGTQRYVKLRKRLDPRGQKSAYVDLRGGREISTIAIDADWRMKGSYTLHGEPDRTKMIATR